MSYRRDGRDDRLEAAVALARDVAPDLDAVLLTHFADPETLDTLRPGEADLEMVRAVNAAVAREMIDRGVEVFVQRADRAAFRRWMQGRDDTRDTRLGWIDRGRLLRGDAALRLLGVPPVDPLPPEAGFGPSPGPVADRLLAAFVEGDEEEVAFLAEDLLAAGRDDVLDLAVRKAAQHHGGANADELAGALLSVAEGGPAGPSGWAELVALPVALTQGRPPDAVSLAGELIASGAVEETEELRFLPEWRSPETLAGLTPGALRRILLDMVSGADPRDLPPGDTDALARDGFGVLLGLRVEWDIPVWDRIAAEDGLPPGPEGEDEEAPGAAGTDAAFDRWRGAVFEASGGCVPLALVPPSEVGAEIGDFLDQAGTRTRGLEEIAEAVAVAKREAGEEGIVCRPEIVGDGLELSFYTEGGRFLGGLTLPLERLPARAVEMPAILGTFVRLVRDTPGR